jgi:hypothetical protein
VISKQLVEAINAEPVRENREREKYVGEAFRLSWNDYEYELEEAPAKGKRSLRVATLRNPQSQVLSRRAFLWQNVMRNVKLSPSDSYETVKDKLMMAMGKAYDLYMSDEPEAAKKNTWIGQSLKWYENTRGSVKFVPEASGPIEVKGKDFSFTAKYDGFIAYSPSSTMNHPGDGDPHYTGYESSSAASARKLYGMVAKDPKLFADMRWSDFDAWLRKNKIGFEYRFSQWT